MKANASNRVCVVGAGVSGLVTTKVLLEKGFEVDVFEKASDLGGTWHPDRTYPELRTNDPRELYRFSDHPYPDSADEFPTAEQVRTYLHSYAERFGLREHMQFCTEVERIGRTEERDASAARFQVQISATETSGESETRSYEYVVVCNGVFSDPHVPEFDGEERFRGPIIHSSDMAGRSQLEGQRVVVVGGGKSAYDCAGVAGEHADSCTMVFRSPHWLAPRYLMGLRSDWLVANRIAQAFLPYHTKHGLARALHGPGKPLVRMFWWFQNWLLLTALDVPESLAPDESLLDGLPNAGVGVDIYEDVRQGNVVPRRTEISAFLDEETIRLETGEEIEADMVVCATGWNQPLDVLEPELRDLVREDGFFTLFRHILPPQERHLGFVGYASSFGAMMTADVAAHWLAAGFRDEMELPDRETMYAEIDKVRDWTRERLPGVGGGYFIGPYFIGYIDQLLRDMDLPTHQADSVVEEYLGRFHADRFRKLGGRRE